MEPPQFLAGTRKCLHPVSAFGESGFVIAAELPLNQRCMAALTRLLVSPQEVEKARGKQEAFCVTRGPGCSCSSARLGILHG